MKKKLFVTSSKWQGRILLRMKITTLLLFFCILQGFANVYSQSTIVRVNHKNANLSKILMDFDRQSEMRFFFEADLFKGTKPVSVTEEKISVQDFLDKYVASNGFEYKVVDNTVVINRAEKTAIPADLRIKQIGKKVRGTVTDENGQPIPGASIMIEGTSKGTIADSEGNYSIDAESNQTLIFSFIGYIKQNVTVGEKKIVNIELKEQNNELEDVTVVAFGKQRKESVIASITTVKPDELKVPASNLTTALAGRMSGLISYQRSGEPGADNAQFFIRGVTTFGYKKDPLILIDNSEVSSYELSRLQPDDISSFSIMKDATATALYGSRGANGVILVTTKGGVEGKAKINVRFEQALSRPTKMVELADPITYMNLHNEAVITRDPLGVIPYSQNKIDNTIAGLNPYVFPKNNWHDILFKKHTINQRLNFNLSGGGKIARYYLAAGVTKDNGMLKVDKMNNFNSNVKLMTYSLRSNVDINISKSTLVTVRLHGIFDDYQGPIDGGTTVFNKVMKTNPVLFPPYYEPDAENLYTKHILFGNYDNGQYVNPYADMVKGYKESTQSKMLAQFELRQNLDFVIKGLSYRALFNTDRNSYFDVSRFYKPFYYKVALYDKMTDTYTLNSLNEKTGTEYLNYSEGSKTVASVTYFENALEWNRKYDEKHSVGGLLVYTMRERKAGNAGDLQQSLPFRNIGFAGRFTYSYDSRYFGEFNFGYNGSERFSKKERFGFFPSAGLGWFVSNEKFWDENLKKTVSKLKLKATYGLVGNDEIGSADDRFFYLSSVNMESSALGSSFGTFGNSGGYTLSGVSVLRYPNEDITWETSRKLNLGVELGFWDNWEFQLDVFKEKRDNILMSRAYVPATMGLHVTPRANVGKASSKGIDVSMNYNHSFNEELWITGMGNFTYATSKFDVYEEPDYSKTPWMSRVGSSLNQNWGYVAERLFVDEEEIRNSPIQFGDYKAGDIKYKDINKDGKITDQDKVPIGYPTSPEIIYGFGATIGYKSFDLNFFFQGSARSSFWIDPEATAPFIGGQSALLKAYADDHWSEDNRNLYALWPRLSQTNIANNQQTSTWFMRDGSFLRLKTVEFGYNISPKLISRYRIAGARVYLSGTNLMTFSKFKLWDPEMGGNGLGYPLQSVYNFGVLLTF